MRTIGVLPIASRMLLKTFLWLTVTEYAERLLSRSGTRATKNTKTTNHFVILVNFVALVPERGLVCGDRSSANRAAAAIPARTPQRPRSTCGSCRRGRDW